MKKLKISFLTCQVISEREYKRFSLDFLENNSLVHKLKLANKYVACAHITCDHGHASSQFLICNDCDLVKEISVDHQVMVALKSKVKSAGFSLRSPQIEMDCVCSNCDQLMENTS